MSGSNVVDVSNVGLADDGKVWSFHPSPLSGVCRNLRCCKAQRNTKNESKHNMNTSIQEFYAKLHSDTALQQRIMEGAQGDVEKVIENAVKLGAGMGYTFTSDEAHAFAMQAENLPDDLLDLVSAGAPIRAIHSGSVNA